MIETRFDKTTWTRSKTQHNHKLLLLQKTEKDVDTFGLILQKRQFSRPDVSVFCHQTTLLHQKFTSRDHEHSFAPSLDLGP